MKINELLHRAWGEAKCSPIYDKEVWRRLQRQIDRKLPRDDDLFWIASRQCKASPDFDPKTLELLSAALHEQKTVVSLRVHCVICKDDLGPQDRTATGAVYFHGSPGYGSKFDSTLLCEETLQIVICDECLEEQAHVMIRYQPRVERPREWLRAWTSDYSCEDPDSNPAPEGET